MLSDTDVLFRFFFFVRGSLALSHLISTVPEWGNMAGVNGAQNMFPLTANAHLPKTYVQVLRGTSGWAGVVFFPSLMAWPHICGQDRRLTCPSQRPAKIVLGAGSAILSGGGFKRRTQKSDDNDRRKVAGRWQPSPAAKKTRKNSISSSSPKYTERNFKLAISATWGNKQTRFHTRQPTETPPSPPPLALFIPHLVHCVCTRMMWRCPVPGQC